ncbi:hypothetical protein BOX15_Mlig000590g1 [Macrostomum lignano]|uniref:SH3 domain-containing protein n=1 Tax=Macrostomum lignano TaxID=282301 RepID=A0A267GJZ9_9PLAT|nr:hypothetical protein BOX15_Mlig000590g1 [Macrostomum lignano]
MQRQQQERSKELPEARVARSRARHGSLRQLHQAAADALSRRLNSARLSLTRQRSVTSADDEASTSTMTSAAAGADAAAVFYDPTSPTSPRPAAAATFSLSGSRRRLSRSPQQLSGPAATSAALSNSKFQLLSPMSQTDRLNSLVHQRSNESHDSTTSGVSMMSVRSSLHSDREFKMDLMNFKKQDSLGCDEAGAPEYSYAAFSSGAAAGAGPGGVGASGSGASGGAGAFISSTGVGGAAKQDEPSVKGLWRRAFNKLKTKDKDKGKKKRSCKDDEDIADVDPVYSLLKRAADKGVQKCSGCSGPTSGTSPRASDASLFSTSPGLSGLRRESLMSKLSVSSPVSSWARRKAAMNAYRMKSISVDHGPPPATAAAAASASIAAIAAAAAAAAASTSVAKDDDENSTTTASNQGTEAEAAPVQVTTVALVTNRRDDAYEESQAEPCDEGEPSSSSNTAALEQPEKLVEFAGGGRTITTQPPKSGTKARPMLDSRKKSVSADSPDKAACGGGSGGGADGGGRWTSVPHRLEDDTKKKSSSFTNTNFIESQAPPNPHRRKQMQFGRNKSLSVDQDNTGSARLRHVELSDESICPRQRLGSEASSSRQSASRESPRRHFGEDSQLRGQDASRPQNKRRLQWKMKSFSLDSPEVKENLTGTAGLNLQGTQQHPSTGTDETAADELNSLGATGVSVSTIETTKVKQPHRNRKMLRDSRLSGNLFVVLYDFKARHRDEMDLRAGFKLSCSEMADPDWWLGRCMGRAGLFPSAYVQRVREGDVIWRVLRPQTLVTDCGGSVKLYRGQIVVQQRPRVSQQCVPIRLKDGRELDCPAEMLERLVD